MTDYLSHIQPVPRGLSITLGKTKTPHCVHLITPRYEMPSIPGEMPVAAELGGLWGDDERDEGAVRGEGGKELRADTSDVALDLARYDIDVYSYEADFALGLEYLRKDRVSLVEETNFVVRASGPGTELEGQYRRALLSIGLMTELHGIHGVRSG
ncbi:uncharacterized protein EV422DRAFT_505013 [Fimicolochytrium jonesii]|uniref:uncharacterized protein n=1 Tax=Fimicolochytrium jonesii TaxID=1396493 RepID=UPI0022FECAEF|nr:uncharacterized protein EV422DRAFT_505013 [Fimicolochytrium jonesii]KAI8822956.1 hypothetical protein EV422DRAFT_505013 [Fimicolochytrium jonesii]